MAVIPLSRASSAAHSGLSTTKNGVSWAAMQKGYGQYCPIAKGAEIFAERWTPVLIRNVHVGAHTFGEIAAGCPRISSTLLAQRLDGLDRAGVIERRPNPGGKGSLYYLTAAGQELVDVAIQLGNWGARWLELYRD